MVFSELQTIALEAALEASIAILEVYHQDFSARIKNDGSPVTKADLISSKLILDKLKHTRLPIINEETPKETYDKRVRWERCWCVDPLDGTKEFIQKNDEFTVNIALIEDGAPTFGIIAIPTQSEIYFGGRHFGTFKVPFNEVKSLDKAQKIIHNTTQEKTLTLLASRSHRSEGTNTYLNGLKKHVETIEILYRGSAMKFVDLAMGRAQLYLRDTPTMEWDVAAGHALLEGVGGAVVDLGTKLPLVYNKKSLFVSGFIATTNLSLLRWQTEGI